MIETFADMGLSPCLLKALAGLGFVEPTNVQKQAIPSALEGGDWMVSSQTGSGKTAAFLLPVMHQLIASGARNWSRGPSALVLCPTRELAQQVMHDAIDLLRSSRGIRVACIVGGMPYGRQMALLKNAAIVVATPGRLLDLHDRGQIKLDTVTHLVLDEADRMLDLGFAPDLEAIDQLCETRQQTLMYSATFAPRVRSLASNMMVEPQQLELASAQHRHTDITQKLHWADDHQHKMKLLRHTLSDPTLEQAVIFASTQIDTEGLAGQLRDEGHAVAALHGGMPQSVRNRQLQGLRDGRIRVLVATDVAARGIDVPTITHVVNFGLPMKAEDYVHRIGRTGRAGRTGTAITLAEPRDRSRIRAIEYLTQHPIAAEIIPGLEPTARERGPGGRPGAKRPGAPRGASPGKPRFGQGGADRRESFKNAAGDRPNSGQPPRNREGRAPRRNG